MNLNDLRPNKKKYNPRLTFAYMDKVYNEEAGLHLMLEIWTHIKDLRELKREPIYYKLTIYLESGYSIFINNNDIEYITNKIDRWKRLLFIKPYYSIPKLKKALCEYIVENYVNYPEVNKKGTFYRDV